MNEQERRDQAKAAHWPDTCPLCGGDFWRGTVKTPHHPECPKANDPIPPLPRPYYSPQDQDRDAAALRSLYAPVLVREEDDPDPDRDDYILGGR